MTMEKNPYHRFTQEELILRDCLAVDRTVLANEKTFLAYIRTALTLFITGVTFIKFFGHDIVEILGWFFIPVGIFTFILGFIRYLKMYRIISQIHQAKKNDHSKSGNIFPPTETDI